MSSEVVISAQAVGKSFLVYKRPEDRLKQFLFGRRRQYYEEVQALKPITLDIRRGETVGVIGRNGSGKSTFLHLVCGTLQPSCGSMTVRGRVAALLELGAGFNPEFTGMENIYMAASILGLSKAQIDTRLDQIVAFADIGDFVGRPVKTYSSGMYARLAFAVAAHVDADILIVDEILAVGDAAFGQKCMRYIHEFKKNGTLLFVSHDAAAVNTLCDRTVWLDAGAVQAVGPSKEITRRYLASLYELEHEPAQADPQGETAPAPRHRAVSDVRAELLHNSTLRNDIELFDFNPHSAGFGERGAEILTAAFVDRHGEPVTVVTGGEEVSLRVRCRAIKALDQPIVGFLVNDRLGQVLFGDNTFLTYCFNPVHVPAGATFSAHFDFALPFLATGDYSVTLAIAEGTQTAHRQHHWLHDAFLFKVHASHIARGLVGVPMHDVGLHVEAAAEVS